MAKLVDGIDSKEATFCLKHAQYAERTKYGTPPKELMIEWLGRIENKETDTQCNVCKISGNRVMVAFPCTQTFKDVLTDLNGQMEPWVIYQKNVFMHEGFLNAYKSIAEDVRRAAYGLWENGKRDVWVTGYSLGGALSTLCAADLSQYFPVKHVSAGSPRVGNAAFHDIYEALNFPNARLVHADDCYTTVPLKELGLGGRTFVHVGNLIHFDEGEVVAVKPHPWYEKVGRWLAKRVSSMLGNPIDLNNAPLHSLSNYLDCLARMG